MLHTVDEITAWLQEQIAPQAAAMDRDPEALAAGLDRLAAAGLLGPLKVDAADGGLGLSPAERWRVQEAQGRTSGALAFLQTQHQSATAFVARSQAPARSELLPRLLRGELRAGIAFGHLRRSGAPMLRARQVAGGFRLDGRAPWFTGWTFFSWCATAATLPDGTTLFVAHPLDEVQVGPVMELAAMEVCRTVALRFDGLFVPEDRVLERLPASWIAYNDHSARARQAAYACGCARAGLDVVAAARGGALSEPVAPLDVALERCRAGLLEQLQTYDPDRALALRAQAIALAGRCAHAGVAAAAGAGNNRSHAAQRVYREALAWTVLSQSAAVRVATVEQLARL